MDIVHERFVGMVISKRDATLCIRVPGKHQGQFTSRVTTWESTTKPDAGVTEVSGRTERLGRSQTCEEPAGARPTFPMRHGWQSLAHTGCCGPHSFRPGLSALRDLARARAVTVQDRPRELQRLEKFLESTGIKLSGMFSEPTGVSSRPCSRR